MNFACVLYLYTASSYYFLVICLRYMNLCCSYAFSFSICCVLFKLFCLILCNAYTYIFVLLLAKHAINASYWLCCSSWLSLAVSKQPYLFFVFEGLKKCIQLWKPHPVLFHIKTEFETFTLPWTLSNGKGLFLLCERLLVQVSPQLYWFW